MKLKEWEHSTYRIVKKFGENLTPQLNTFGLEGELESTAARRATVSKCEAQFGFLAFWFHPVWQQSLSSQQFMSSEVAPSIFADKIVRDTGKKLPQKELRNILKQMEENNKRQPLDKQKSTIWLSGSSLCKQTGKSS